MRKLIMWNVITLDGYFEGKQPWDLGFHELVWGKELEDLSNEQLALADIVVYGKNTYLGMADYWSTADESPAKQMNAIRKVVCSTTLKEATWNNTSIVRDAVSDIGKLKLEGDKPMFVFGSSILSHSLMNAGLFDEYRLCVAPVFLGQGRLLFTEALDEQRVELLEARPLASGGLLLRYGPAQP